jgi:hypothetical protein
MSVVPTASYASNYSIFLGIEKVLKASRRRAKGMSSVWVNIYVYVVVLEINKLYHLNIEIIGSHPKFTHPPFKRKTSRNSVCTARKGYMF